MQFGLIISGDGNPVSAGAVTTVWKREELVSTAAQKLKENGYRATRLADIGQQANIDPATV